MTTIPTPAATVLPGDTVKLRDIIARRMTLNSRKDKIDWIKRRGYVKRLGVYRTVAHVMWPGNATVDILPVAALEKV